MAAPMANDTSPSPEKKIQNLTPEDVKNFSLIVDNVIGEKRKIRNYFMPFGTVPQMPKSREEVMIGAFFESCGFRSAASCVVGELRDIFLNYYNMIRYIYCL